MFEKEAEEKYCKGCKLRIEQCLWAWRNTNGLNEPNEKNCSCIKVPAYIAGAEFGYNKANEWHYVKDGINPTHSYRVLVFTDEGVGFGIYGLDDKKWHTYDTGFEVIAWKEIVLPKESK